jgi:hypothetical protein
VDFLYTLILNLANMSAFRTHSCVYLIDVLPKEEIVEDIVHNVGHRMEDSLIGIFG